MKHSKQNTPIFVDVIYHDGIPYANCKWSLVNGYVVNEDNVSDMVECWPMLAKPTKRQIRQYKKMARKWRDQFVENCDWEDVVIDVLGMVGEQ